MTIRHLRIFIEVGESENMSKAASNLFISQPTVSQAIKELEDHYGMLLFERLKKKLHITEAGKKLLFYAKGVVNQFDSLEEQMFNLNKFGKIKIGGTVTVGECILSDIISKFKEKNPKIEVYSYVNNTKIIEEKLLKGEIDIGIVEGKIKSKDLVEIPQVQDHLVLICSNNHPFVQRKSIKLEELGEEKFAMREKGSGTRHTFEEYMKENKIPIHIVFEGNSPEAIKREVIKNNYLAVISIGLVENEIKDSSIYVIENLQGAWDRYFSVVYHKDKVFTNGMNSLIEIIKSYEYMPERLKFSSGILIK